MKKVRRNALHRAVEEMSQELKQQGISINPDRRIGTSIRGDFNFQEGLTKEQCKREIRKQIKAIKELEKEKQDELF